MNKNKPTKLDNIPLGYTYDDVLLVPRHSKVRSRQEVSLNTKVSTSLKLHMPVISANMDSVTESEMAIAMAEIGGLGIIHRFLPPHEQAEEVARVKLAESSHLVGVAVGTDHDAMDRAKVCVDAGANVLVLDIAHGHSEHAIDTLKQLKELHPETDVIAGNVATVEGAADLAKAGANGIKVGVGPGGVCTTRLVAGVGVPQLTAIANISAANLDVPIIADGGIRNSGDMAKALAVGADSVMIGSLLAGTKESPGELESTPKGLVKRIRGMASKEAVEARAAREGQELEDEYFEQRAPEGVSGTVPCKGEASKIIGQLMAGLKSSMSYLDATNLDEFQANADFVRITPAGLTENHPHAT